MTSLADHITSVFKASVSQLIPVAITKDFNTANIGVLQADKEENGDTTTIKTKGALEYNIPGVRLVATEASVSVSSTKSGVNWGDIKWTIAGVIKLNDVPFHVEISPDAAPYNVAANVTVKFVGLPKVQTTLNSLGFAKFVDVTLNNEKSTDEFLAALPPDFIHSDQVPLHEASIHLYIQPGFDTYRLHHLEGVWNGDSADVWIVVRNLVMLTNLQLRFSIWPAGSTLNKLDHDLVRGITAVTLKPINPVNSKARMLAAISGKWSVPFSDQFLTLSLQVLSDEPTVYICHFDDIQHLDLTTFVKLVSPNAASTNTQLFDNFKPSTFPLPKFLNLKLTHAGLTITRRVIPGMTVLSLQNVFAGVQLAGEGDNGWNLFDGKIVIEKPTIVISIWTPYSLEMFDVSAQFSSTIAIGKVDIPIEVNISRSFIPPGDSLAVRRELQIKLLPNYEGVFLKIGDMLHFLEQAADFDIFPEPVIDILNKVQMSDFEIVFASFSKTSVDFKLARFGATISQTDPDTPWVFGDNLVQLTQAKVLLELVNPLKIPIYGQRRFFRAVVQGNFVFPKIKTSFFVDIEIPPLNNYSYSLGGKQIEPRAKIMFANVELPLQDLLSHFMDSVLDTNSLLTGDLGINILPNMHIEYAEIILSTVRDAPLGGGSGSGSGGSLTLSGIKATIRIEDWDIIKLKGDTVFGMSDFFIIFDIGFPTKSDLRSINIVTDTIIEFGNFALPLHMSVTQASGDLPLYIEINMFGEDRPISLQEIVEDFVSFAFPQALADKLPEKMPDFLGISFNNLGFSVVKEKGEWRLFGVSVGVFSTHTFTIVPEILTISNVKLDIDVYDPMKDFQLNVVAGGDINLFGTDILLEFEKYDQSLALFATFQDDLVIPVQKIMTDIAKSDLLSGIGGLPIPTDYFSDIKIHQLRLGGRKEPNFFQLSVAAGIAIGNSNNFQSVSVVVGKSATSGWQFGVGLPFGQLTKLGEIWEPLSVVDDLGLKDAMISLSSVSPTDVSALTFDGQNGSQPVAPGLAFRATFSLSGSFFKQVKDMLNVDSIKISGFISTSKTRFEAAVQAQKGGIPIIPGMLALDQVSVFFEMVNMIPGFGVGMQFDLELPIPTHDVIKFKGEIAVFTDASIVFGFGLREGWTNPFGIPNLYIDSFYLKFGINAELVPTIISFKTGPKGFRIGPEPKAIKGAGGVEIDLKKLNEIYLKLDVENVTMVSLIENLTGGAVTVPDALRILDIGFEEFKLEIKPPTYFYFKCKLHFLGIYFEAEITVVVGVPNILSTKLKVNAHIDPWKLAFGSFTIAEIKKADLRIDTGNPSELLYLNGDMNFLRLWDLKAYAYAGLKGLDIHININTPLYRGEFIFTLSLEQFHFKTAINFGIKDLSIGPLTITIFGEKVKIFDKITLNANIGGSMEYLSIYKTKTLVITLEAGFQFLGLDMGFTIGPLTLDFGNLGGWDDWTKIPRKIIDYILDHLEDIFKGLWEDMKRFLNWVKDGIIKIGKEIATVLKKVWNQTVEEVAKLLKSIGRTLEEVAEAIKDAFNLAADAVAKICKELWNDIVAIGRMLKNVFQVAYEALEGIFNAIGYVGEAIKDAIEAIFCCFPVDGVVYVLDRYDHTTVTRTTIENLKLGDLVETVDDYGNVCFSSIYYLDIKRVASTMIAIEYEDDDADVIVLPDDVSVSSCTDVIIRNKNVIRATRDHLLFVTNDENSDMFNAVKAGNVKIGDYVWVRHENVVVQKRVVKITEQPSFGLCTITTNTGRVIVDNVMASCFEDVPQPLPPASLYNSASMAMFLALQGDIAAHSAPMPIMVA